MFISLEISITAMMLGMGGGAWSFADGTSEDNAVVDWQPYQVPRHFDLKSRLEPSAERDKTLNFAPLIISDDVEFQPEEVIPCRDQPGPDWIFYDDGRAFQGEGRVRNYWSRVRFAPRAEFVLQGVKFKPGNFGPSHEPCFVRVYREDQQRNLDDLVWDFRIPELRPWFDGGDNWHFVEIPENDRPAFDEGESFTIMVGPAPAAGNPEFPQEGDGWWMLADEESESGRSYIYAGRIPQRNHRVWGIPFAGDLIIRANGEYQRENVTINVPDDFETIQEAIDNGFRGDTILVQPGVYEENISFEGKNLVLGSMYLLTREFDFIRETIIDGGGEGSVVSFRQGEDETAELVGFTIRNGRGFDNGVNTFGGGIICTESSPTIRNVHIMDNEATQGGGLYCERADPLLINCNFIGNSARYGGGLFAIFEAAPVVGGCVLRENEAEIGGAAFYSNTATVDFRACHIDDNAASERAAGLYCQLDVTGEVRRCEFTQNHTDGNGGAIYFIGGASLDLEECLIFLNIADWGGGIYGQDDTGTLVNRSQIVGNMAVNGGGVGLRGSNPLIQGCNIWSNRADFGGGVVFFEASHGRIEHSLINNNNAVETAGAIYCGEQSNPELVSCQLSADSAALAGAVACFDASNPQFIDCELSENAAEIAGGLYAVGSHPEFRDCLFESNDGGEIGGAAFLNQGSNARFDGCEFLGNQSTQRSGGIYFQTGGEAVLRGCRFEGNLSGMDGGAMFMLAGASPIIENCLMELNIADRNGGGVFSQGSDLQIFGCDIRENVGNNGGGVYLVGNAPRAWNTSFVRNRARLSGGGVYLDGADSQFQHCSILQNSADRFRGGGIYLTESDAAFTECRIQGNSAESDGGGVHARRNSETVFTACEITRNFTAVGGGLSINSNITLNRCVIAANEVVTGGGFRISASAPRFINTDVVDNIAETAAAGYLTSGAQVRFLNSIIWGNGEESIVFDGEGEANQAGFAYSDVEQGEDAILTGDNGEVDWGDGNIDEDPLFVNAEDGDYHLRQGSPCIDAGDPDSPADPDETDADIGAFYYHQGPGIRVEPDSLGFGVVEVGRDSARAFTVINFGDDDLRIFDVVIEGEGFSVAFDDDVIVEPGDSVDVVVTFAPDDDAEYNAMAAITSNDPLNDLVDVALTGWGFQLHPPQVENPIGDLVLEENSPPFMVRNLNEVFIDEDGDDLTYRAESDDENLTAQVDEDENLWLEAAADWRGGTNVSVFAGDGIFETEHRFAVQVVHINIPPVEFDLALPEDGARLTEALIWFAWEASSDAEDSTITYALGLSFAEEDRWFRDIEGTSIEIPNQDIAVEPGVIIALEWVVWASDGTDSTRCRAPFALTVEPLRVDGKDSALPAETRLGPVYPNPINDRTRVRFDLAAPAEVHVAVFDLSGRTVKALLNGRMAAGRHALHWNGDGSGSGAVPAGLYLVRMRAGEWEGCERLVLLR